ncbi:MAG: septal ring lytic transglycosylase RlpA family protein [Alphaproteobacteria bacterium]
MTIHAERRIGRAVALTLLGLILTACAETQLLAHTVKQVNGGDSPSTGDFGPYKVGNAYEIGGVWYYPAEDFGYAETGIASWYGPGFHGKATANGARYDQNALTAAHRTLPMPSAVRVTNLENGRALNLVVNDRGPFAHGRIIDVSRRAAQLLGFENRGTARVKVEILVEESLGLRLASGGSGIQPVQPVDAVPVTQVASSSLEPVEGGSEDTAAASDEAAPATAALSEAPAVISPGAAPAVTVNPDYAVVAVGNTRLFIQAGAFTVYDNAYNVQRRLAAIGDVTITAFDRNGAYFYRVRLGPITSIELADAMLEEVIKAGYPEAKVIVD